HAEHLAEELVLQVGRGDVVQHREAGGAGEAPVLEWHLGGVALHDLGLVAQLGAQVLAVVLFELEDAQLAGPPHEHAARGTEARTDLERVVAEVDPLETPGEQLVLDAARPPAGGAEQVVNPVHGTEPYHRCYIYVSG